MENKSDCNPNSSPDWRKSTFMNKLKHILTHGIMADLTIRLVNGVDITEYNVHSIFFVIASKVFEKMLQSSFKEGLTKTIEMRDVKPEILDILLNYLYGQPLNISNLDHIKDLTELANYYLMDDLKTEIINYCKTNETAGIACIGIEVAESCEAPSLKDCKLQYITNNTFAVVNHQNFLKASLETIKTILDQDKLNIKEIDIFNAVQKWIKHNISGTEESLTEILIRKVRFFSMTPKEFIEGPVSSKLLKPEDIVSLLSLLVHENCLIPLPEGFTKVKRYSHRNHLMLTSLPSLTSCGKTYDIAVQVNKKIWLTHLIIYPLITNGVYEEMIKIVDFTNPKHPKIATFEGKVDGSNNIEVEFDQPFQLEAGKTYKLDVKCQSGSRKCVNLPDNVINCANVSFSFELWENSGCPLHSVLFDC